jgi:hypothetical protein
VQIVLRHLLEIGVQADGRVGDHDVETAEGRDRIADDPLDVRPPAHVADARHPLRPCGAHDVEGLIEAF